jgi:peptide/nickel transport system substrate-binding protein
VKPGLKWSDGTPVNGEDLLFDFDLIKALTKASPANYCQYASPTQFPFNVKSISASGNSLTMHLTGKVNPNWFVANQLQDTNGGMYPLPATDWDVDASGKVSDWATNPKDALAIGEYLQKEGADVSTYATSPLWKVVDGPYKLKSFSATNSSYVLTPNSSYGLSPKAHATFAMNTYTSSTAMLNAMESGSLDIGNLDAGTQLNSIPTLKSKGYSVFGGPSWGWFGGYFNFKDKTNDFDKVIAQTYIRGVFAELADQSAIVSHVYHGWAVPAYGPVPEAPSSPYVPSNVLDPAYKYSPTKAVATLKAHGWDVKPGGETTCAKPGTGSSECGAGIPKGTPIKFVWANVPESTASTGVLESEAFASEAKAAAGIDVTFQTKTFNFLTSNYNNENPAAKKYYNDWGVNNYGGVFIDYYPTQDGILNTTGSLNDGSYSDPTADKLMAASIVSPSTAAIKKEVSYLSKSYPVFFFPDQDYIMSISKRVGGTVDGFTEMTQQSLTPSLLYVKK